MFYSSPMKRERHRKQNASRRRVALSSIVFPFASRKRRMKLLEVRSFNNNVLIIITSLLKASDKITYLMLQ